MTCTGSRGELVAEFVELGPSAVVRAIPSENRMPRRFGWHTLLVALAIAGAATASGVQ